MRGQIFSAIRGALSGGQTAEAFFAEAPENTALPILVQDGNIIRVDSLGEWINFQPGAYPRLKQFFINGVLVGTGNSFNAVDRTGTLIFRETVSNNIGTATVDSAPIELETIRVIGVNGRVHTDRVSSTLPRYRTRHADLIGYDAEDLIITGDHWYMLPAGEQVNLNDANILEASVEINGIVQPVYFSGVRTKSVVAGDTKYMADPIPAAAFGLEVIPQNTLVYIEADFEVLGAGTKYMPYRSFGNDYDITGQKYGFYDPAVTTLSSVDTPGPITSSGTGWGNQFGFRFNILGHPAVYGKRYFMGTGDSILNSLQDGSQGVYGPAYLSRALRTLEAGKPLPGFNASVSSLKVDQLISGTRWKAYLEHVTDVIEAMGTNSNSESVAGYKTKTLNFWQILRDAGIQNIIRTQLQPKTNSTDSWATLSGQTLSEPATTFHNELNVWFGEQLAAGLIDAYVDLSQLRSDAEPSKWEVGSGNTRLAADSVGHPTSFAHTTMAASLAKPMRQIAGIPFGLEFAMPKWAAAKSAGNPRLLCIGDSTTFGVRGSSPEKYNGWPAYLKNYLRIHGIAAHDNVIVSASSYQYENNLSGAEPRMTVTSGWVRPTSPDFTVGGSLMSNSTTANVLGFTPNIPVDNFKVLYRKFVGGGVIRFNIDGGTNFDIDTNATEEGIGELTLSAPLGTHTLNMNKLSGARIDIIGLEGWDSSVNQMTIMNAGWPGAKSIDCNHVTYPWSSARGIRAFAPDLTIINLGINDRGGSVPVADYKTAIETIIIEASVTGDVLLMTHFPGGSSEAIHKPIELTYAAKIHELSDQYESNLIDMQAFWYHRNRIQGFYADEVHPSNAGYQDAAHRVFDIITL